MRKKNLSPRQNQSTMPGVEKMVLTPGGYRPLSKVHQVGIGHHLRSQNGRLLLVNTSSDKPVKDLGLSQNGAPPVLSRLFRQFSSLHTPGTQSLASPIPQLGNGWVAYAEWVKLEGQPLSRFTAEWQVPPAPKQDSGQTIFLFIGMQNTHFIMQPVLQWGPSAAGGGPKWTIANWYAGSDNSNTCYTQSVEVKEGDSLNATIQLLSQDNRSFKYSAAFQGFPSLDLEKDDVIELFLANVVLETYNVTLSAEYPATPQTQMSKLQLFTGTSPAQPAQPAWQLMPAQPVSNRPHTISNPGSDTIYLNYGQPPALSSQ